MISFNANDRCCVFLIIYKIYDIIIFPYRLFVILDFINFEIELKINDIKIIFKTTLLMQYFYFTYFVDYSKKQHI